MSENLDPIEEQSVAELEGYEPGVTFTTACEQHEWARTEDDPNSDMESYICIKCNSGMNKTKEI